jgi:hypothetical protein
MRTWVPCRKKLSLDGEVTYDNQSAKPEAGRVGGTFHSETLTGITREQQEWKAVKLDDAKVPKYLWEEQLLKGLQAQEWNQEKPTKVRRVSTWLQSKMLRWWK